MNPRLQPAPFPTRRALLILAAGFIGLLLLGWLVRAWVTPQTENLISLEGIYVQESYRLAGTHEDDLVVLATGVQLDAGSRIHGDASLVGDRVVVEGEIDGDLTVIATTIEVTDSAAIGGDVALMGETIRFSGRAGGDVQATGRSFIIGERGTASGNVLACAETVENRGDVRLAPCEERQRFAPFAALLDLRDGLPLASMLSSSAWTIESSLGSALQNAFMLAGLSALAVVLFPRQLNSMSSALRRRPIMFLIGGITLSAFAVGLVIAEIVLLAALPPVGLLALPLLLLALLGLLVLGIAGMIAVSAAFGGWLLARLNREAPALISAALGGLILSVGLSALAFLPFGVIFSGAAGLIIGMFGLGAAAFTRLGTTR
ncbi:polymer-forming cytoskeletal protein [Anaerolineae bacterium CFX9]|nr:polymer-forming cytoskeletal protein [Anaerolineae bacterium CFX9]